MEFTRLMFTRLAFARSPMFWIGLLGGLAAGGLVILCGLILWEGRRDAKNQSDRAASNVVAVVEQDIARSIENFDLSLLGVIRGLGEPEVTPLTGRARSMALFDNAATAPYINAIVVLDETGKVAEDSRQGFSGANDFSDRNYFKVHKDNPNAGMYMSPPLKSRVNDGWIIALSRRISNPDGSFGGVVVGTLQLGYFQALFEHLLLGKDGTITLVQSDGTLVARKAPEWSDIGRNFSNIGLFKHFPAARAGNFEAVTTIDGIARRYTYSQIKQLPLVVSVGISVDEIYAPWRQKALTIGIALACLLLATLALAIVLSHELIRRKRADTLLRESETRYRHLADNSSDAIILRDPQGRRKYASSAFFPMLGRTPEEMGAEGLEPYLHPDSLGTPPKTLQRLLTGEQRVVALLQYAHPDGHWMWLEAISSGIFDEHGNMTEIVTNLRDVTRRKAAEDKLAAAAITDGMTGLGNRRAFDDRLEQEWQRAVRAQSSLALLMIDVDYFKAYNDTFGHLQGDGALTLVSACISENLRRAADFAARYGGEEFVVILPDTDDVGASHVAENIRNAVVERTLVHPASPATVLTVSIGLTSRRPAQGDEVSSLIRLADAALYQAKQNGRNQTALSPPAPQNRLAAANS
ncbi:diguanylate cyclase [Roseiarcaceae bacterium H3SJ34-1]|uniref:diguanylate cyclase n=1 Tax=Terripilifer ovatus TaxID=3032367 RepID=UPI003AB9454A|nr:diguanylate cyclase [Roseiarcaceae bacterium H3SJ34-1]